MSDERTIKSLLKQAQKMVHSSPGGSVAQKMAKRRSIILRGAQRDTEKGKDHEIEFGESKKHGKKITKLHGKEYPKGTHMCATHVEHAEWGEGTPIHSQHAAPDENGHIDWYDVMFEHGVERNVATADMNVLAESSHMEHAHHATDGEDLAEKKVSAPKGFHFMKHGDGKYKLMKHKGKFKPHEGGSSEADFPLQKVHTEEQLKTESYFGRMESMGKKMGKMARRLSKDK